MALNINDTSNATCSSIQELFPDYVDQSWIRITFGVLYSTVMVLGAFGSILTLYCVLRLKIQVGIHCAFIASLTFSNLLIISTSLPFTAIQIFAREWILGRTLCHAVPLIQAAGIFVCSFTLAAIAIDRYRIVSSNQLSNRVPWQTYTKIVLILWMLAFLMAFPYAAVMHLFDYEKEYLVCGLYCEENWPSQQWRVAYGFTALVVQFVFPLAILFYCYCRLRRFVKRSVRRRLTYEVSSKDREKLAKRTKKTSRITSLLFVAFVCPWLPYNLLNVLRDHLSQHHLKVLERYEFLLFAIVHLTAMTSTMWNPPIYCWLNSDFKIVLSSIVACWKKGFSENDLRASLVSTYLKSDGRCGGGHSRKEKIFSKNKKAPLNELLLSRKVGVEKEEEFNDLSSEDAKIPLVDQSEEDVEEIRIVVDTVEAYL